MANTTCNNGSPDCDNPATVTFAFDGVSSNPTIKDGKYVPPDFCKGTADYSTSECAEKEASYIAGLMAESLNMAAGPVNIFPLLGVHNQGSTLDQPGNGFPLSSGTPSGYNTLAAFTVDNDSWRSIQQGAAVLTTPATIGYDFGTKTAWESIGPPQERNFPSAPTRKKISTIKIRQGIDPINRATQLRVEASDDGVVWHRVDVVTLPNTDQLVTVGVRSVAGYNKWRLVPTFFNGVATNSQWEVVELHLLESTQLSLDNIEDYVLLENRDRAYCRSSTFLKCTYDLLDVQTELAKFGINIPQTYIFTCSFAEMVKLLGRPVIIGDIVELPGEIQYDAHLRPIRKWLEVTDTGWSTEGYTLNWKPNLYRFYAQPIMPSVEHQDILGLPGQSIEAQSDSSFLIDGLLNNNQAYDATEAIKQEAADAVPQTGSDPANLQSGKPLIGPKGQYDGNDLYAEDAIPSNGIAYTSGDTLPINPPNGSFHRQTYTLVAASIRPEDRLLQWSTASGRWKVVEINTRGIPNSHKKTIDSIMRSSTKINPDTTL